MQEERDEVACHESNGVSAGAEARVLCPVDDNDAGEAEIDGRGEEGGADGEDNEIHQEGWVCERVLSSVSVKLLSFRMYLDRGDGHRLTLCIWILAI